MNTIRLYLLVVCLSATVASSIYGQSRSQGHMTVPLGWENRDSIRFSLWGLFEWEPWKDGYRANLEMDTALANSIGDFGIIPLNYAPLGLRVGGAIASAGTGTVLDALMSIKQRIFYPFPKTTALWGSCLNGGPLQWNYIETSAMYHTWMYDKNDISRAFFVTILLQQQIRFDFQGLSDFFKSSHTDRIFGTFQTCDIVRRKPRKSGQRFLCKVSPFSVTSDVIAKYFV